MSTRGVRTAAALAALFVAGAAGAAPPVDIRIENLTVLPSTGPLAQVLLRNPGKSELTGSLEAVFPAGFKLGASTKDFTLKPGGTQRIAFAIEKGRDDPANAYPVEVRARIGDRTVRAARTVVVATAPYFKPAIDGSDAPWTGAVPATFVSGGRKTTVRMLWSRRQFSMQVEVEEDALKPPDGAAPFDAVQFALAPGDAGTPDRAEAEDRRYEYLLTATDGGTGACYTLCTPGQPLAVARKSRPLAGRETPDAKVHVWRADGRTRYAVAIPFKPMSLIRPEPGREFCFSILVHDPDGTGLRDWGEAAGLWPDRRNPLAWCDWPGATWPERPPFDNKIEWGFCSSKQ